MLALHDPNLVLPFCFSVSSSMSRDRRKARQIVGWKSGVDKPLFDKSRAMHVSRSTLHLNIRGPNVHLGWLFAIDSNNVAPLPSHFDPVSVLGAPAVSIQASYLHGQDLMEFVGLTFRPETHSSRLAIDLCFSR
ncbi:hypothetical protein RRG08_026276 [Elysia crispata]|uniref:Uncharacterized protein n=1 Tax=Elysia crispata TaxID=231223 RepID=A0AAE0ZBT6_9GAST|nr:hypothetical protein RRG08_026276 [Elysia crispata]